MSKKRPRPSQRSLRPVDEPTVRGSASREIGRQITARRRWTIVTIAALSLSSMGAWVIRNAIHVTPPVLSDRSAIPVSSAPSPAMDHSPGASPGDKNGETFDSKTRHVAESIALATARWKQGEHERQTLLDPHHDGWQSEIDVATMEKIVRDLLREQANLGTSTTNSLAFVSDDFTCAPLRPLERDTIYHDDSLEVVRANAEAIHAPASFVGAQGLTQALQQLHAAVGNFESTDWNVEVIGVSRHDGHLAARLRIEGNLRAVKERRQWRAIWDTLWSRHPEHLRLAAIRPRQHEEVTLRGGPSSAIWFEDSTQSVIGNTASFQEQLAWGLDEWLQRIERAHRMHIFSAHGLAIGDANNDGRDDLFVCQPGGLPNRLYLQSADGTLIDHSLPARIDWLDATSSALFLDLDNDDDQDLVFATHAGLVVMQNQGAALFRTEGLLPTGGDMQSLSASDYDLDGDLDLYICLNIPPASDPGTSSAASRFSYHDANDGAANHLFRNDIDAKADWIFTDVTRSSGLDIDNRRHSLAASWEDYDNDGDPDLYVANNYGQNCLYRNDGGKFVNVAQAAGVVDYGSGMSVSWGDYDHDGWFDLYVGNTFSSAGSRIATQDNFRPEADPRTRSMLQRFAKGNSLFQNTGHGSFQDVGGAFGVEMGRWAWSSLFADLDNSGAEDLVIANGYMTTASTGDLVSYLWRHVVSRETGPIDVSVTQPRDPDRDETALHEMLRQGLSLSGHERHCAYLNIGQPSWADISSVSGLDLPDDGRGAAVVDWDQDGDLDVWFANRSGPQVRFLRNRLPNDRHYVALRLIGRQCNRDAIGARVEIVQSASPTGHQIKAVRAGEGYLSQTTKWLHFGLGDDAAIEKVIVYWPGGTKEVFSDVTADRHYRLVQGSGHATIDASADRAVAITSERLADATQSAEHHLFLSSALPLPRLDYERPHGDVAMIEPAAQRLQAICLWSRACAVSWTELSELAARQEQLTQDGIDVIALDVDRAVPTSQGPNEGASSPVPPPWESQLPGGFATNHLLDKLQLVQDELFDRHRPLSVPLCVVINADRQLIAWHQGRVSAEQLLLDHAMAQMDAPGTRSASVPFPGRWLSNSTRVSLWPIYRSLIQMGLDAEAEEFRQRNPDRCAAPTNAPNDRNEKQVP